MIMLRSNVVSVEELLDLIPLSWKEFLGDEIFKQHFWNNIVKALNESEFTPPLNEIFNAFRLNPQDIKVVIIGQDPYPQRNVAHGYSFSVRDGNKLPPSFKNILKELCSEYEIKVKNVTGNLEPWVDEGVFLLNSLLTTKVGVSKTHNDWLQFTSYIIKRLSMSKNILFICWGSVAKGLVKSENVLFSGHPSPLNRKNDFIDNEHFIKANRWLIERNILPIRWMKIFE
jgi:uracil-DNA glycosylase